MIRTDKTAGWWLGRKKGKEGERQCDGEGNTWAVLSVMQSGKVSEVRRGP